MDWLDLLTVQETLKSLLQHHSSNVSIPQHSVILIGQLLHHYMTIGKTIALTRQTFVDKVMSLLFNMQPRLIITFFSRSKRLLISWLQSLSAVILDPLKIKSATVSTVSPSICHEVMGPDTMTQRLHSAGVAVHGAGATVRRYPCLRAKEKPQKDHRRGKITFRIKPHTQRHSEGLNILVYTRSHRRHRD